MIHRLCALLGALACVAPAIAHAGCGPAPEPCDTASGRYHIALPDTAAGAPVVLFLHGYGSNGGNVIRNTGLVQGFVDRGYAVIAPDAELREPGGRAGWVFYPGWSGRDETAFLTGIVQDAATRFGTDPDDAILSGFSSGGFMVNYLACAAPDSFAAYAPVAGGFWKPHPDSCAGPVRLFHTHGWRDGVVPLEGRSLGGGRFQQGDIFAGLAIWRAANDCDDEKPTGFSRTGDFERRRWDNCSDGSALEFALFPGGHTIPPGWSDMMLDWYEALDD
ncbi:MAG: polyhydroxybutyrate depolymerase [Marinibacterium sp.]|nr:polyhydroxybutyrate depolymerase [Marinibacterium sp.]